MRLSIVSLAATAALCACGGRASTTLPMPPVAQTTQAMHGTARYTVTALQTLGGATASAAGINNIGWVTGASALPSGSNEHAAVWERSTMPIDLGTLGGPNSAVAWPVKSVRGDIVGIAETPAMQPLGENWSCALAVFPGAPDGHVCLAFLNRRGHMTALPTLGGDNGFGTGINDRGTAVGWAETSVHDPTCVPPQVLQFEATTWDARTQQARALAPYPGDADGAATAIDAAGDVVGISGICDQAVGRFSAAHAVLWIHGNPQNLGSLGGVAWNTPMAINNAGTIVGFSDLPGDGNGTPNFHAFVWMHGGPMRDLGVLPGDTYSEALGVNDGGTIVGVSYDANFNGRAFVYRNGKMQDLNDLLGPNPQLDLIYANDVDDSGAITGGACVLASGACTSSAPVFLARPNRHATLPVENGIDARGPIAAPPAVRRMLMNRLGMRAKR